MPEENETNIENNIEETNLLPNGIRQANASLNFSYDSSIVGNISNDNEYRDPNNKEFIWPAGYVRINSVRWMDTNLGRTAPDPLIYVESFNGVTENGDVIEFRPDRETYEKDDILISPIMEAFIKSPFCDADMIDRETERFMTKVDEEEFRYQSFKKNFDPEEQRAFNEWKASGNPVEQINTNFDGPKSVWEAMSNATTEDLFKFKLDIFEQPIVQESTDRNLRSSIRKAKSICEVCAHYQALIDAESEKKETEED